MGHFAVVDVEPLKESVVEIAAYLAVAVLVEIVGVRNEVEGVTEDTCADGELFGSCRETCFDAGAGDLDIV
ncbi:hypothetical protein [Mycolicibacterium doricum]|uniref:Uncharacterized protein n=1 Tax=Mycolicibacterium doricum TaxID=126673 RepID=A0A1X1T2X1_9MYCO|nr:hypothetical protein [Mycolicibacterium doricum]MCV7268671.1 hypothetical protein [Mycolicibacterium doricum]ORV38674.1 hypothetical protein AWC01_14040 [Mycolicibacterium doricum]